MVRIEGPRANNKIYEQREKLKCTKNGTSLVSFAPKVTTRLRHLLNTYVQAEPAADIGNLSRKSDRQFAGHALCSDVRISHKSSTTRNGFPTFMFGSRSAPCHSLQRW